MNYLAHAFLSPEDPHILMGNLWGDLLRPKDYSDLDPGILEGVKLHRRIDTFTDQHESVDQIIKLIRPYQGKYTPVVADVMMDYTLSKFWDLFHDHNIEHFCEKKYRVVKDHLHLIPERLHYRIGRMIENQWLESCKNRERMKVTFLMLSKRASFENQIADAMHPYDVNEYKMDQLFLTFFNDIRKHLTLQSEG